MSDTAISPIRIVAMQRRSDMDRPAFRTHWKEVHGPLMAAVPGIHYLQNHVLGRYEDSGAFSTVADIDGFARIAIPLQPTSPAPARSAPGSAAAQDLPNFVGASSRMMCGTKAVVLPPSSDSSSKLVSVIHGRSGAAGYPRLVEAVSPDLIAFAAIPYLIGVRANMVTSYLPPTDPRIAEAQLDAVAVLEFWFAAEASIAAGLRSPAWRRACMELARCGCGITSYLVDEVRIV